MEQNDTNNANIQTKNTTPKKDPVAILSLIFGIISIFFASIGIIPLGAIILGAVGISRTKEKGTGRWMAIVGLCLGIIFLISNLYINGHFQSSYEKCVEDYKANTTFTSFSEQERLCGHLR